jgi:hypothetical protein
VFEYIHCNKYQILTNSNQQNQSYKFTSHMAAFLSVVLITEMLEICIQTSYDQNVQLILKSYLPVVYVTTLNRITKSTKFTYVRERRTLILSWNMLHDIYILTDLKLLLFSYI